MLPRKGRQCFADGSIKDEFVLKLYLLERMLLSQLRGVFRVSALFSLPRKKKTFNFRNVHMPVICGEWPGSVSGKLVFSVCEWVVWVCLWGFFSLNCFGAVVCNFYVKSHCNLKLGTWPFVSVTPLTIQNFYELWKMGQNWPWPARSWDFDKSMLPCSSPHGKFLISSGCVHFTLFFHFFWLKAVYKAIAPC